jgi:molecular chaperone GrpE
MSVKFTDDEFINLWNKFGSANEISKASGMSLRGVNARRRKIEEKTGQILAGISSRSPDFKVTYPDNGVRTKVELDKGVIMVASDCHYWPGVISAAHKAFVHLIKQIKPKIIIINGDVFDGAGISRFPAADWQALPTVKQELEACQDRVNEIESATELSIEEKLQEDLANEKDKFLRLFAEFENFKRRTAKERIDLFKTANQDVLQSMLPVLDDFDRAMLEISKSDDDVLLKGVELIHEKLKTALISKGLEQVEVRVGDSFNADFAEAITQIPAPTDDLKGKIVDVIEKGYKLGDKIIRFPKVVIGN